MDSRGSPFRVVNRPDARTLTDQMVMRPETANSAGMADVFIHTGSERMIR